MHFPDKFSKNMTSRALKSASKNTEPLLMIDAAQLDFNCDLIHCQLGGENDVLISPVKPVNLAQLL